MSTGSARATFDRIRGGLPFERAWILVGVAALLCLYAALGVAYALPRATVENVDFYAQVALAKALDLGETATLVDGLYPVGYPALLRPALAGGIDVVRFGQVVSWLGGMLCLFGVCGLTAGCTRRSLGAAAAAAAVLLLNPEFLRHAVQEGTHMPAAGLQVLAVWLLRTVDPRQGRSGAAAQLALAGVCLGLAYLVRYQALMLVPVALAYVIWNAWPSRAEAARSVAILVAAFALIAAPQLVPSVVVHGQPFFNEQVKNVWFGMHGQQDWAANWASAPDNLSLIDIVAADPLRFLGHWTDGIVAYVNTRGAWPGLLYGAWLVGTALLLFDRRVQPQHRFLLVGTMVVPVAVTAMAWVALHFLLVPLAVQAVLVGYTAHRAADALRPAAAARTAALAGLVAVGVLIQAQTTADLLREPARTLPHEVNALLRLAGMRDPTTVATNDPYLHATDQPDREPYAPAFAASASPASLAELLGHPSAQGWRFLVLNYADGYGDYHTIREAPDARPALAPLRLDDRIGVYCLGTCGIDMADPSGGAFENGMELVAHRLLAREEQHALLLYWRADRALDRSYKVSARTIDAEARLVAQSDEVPQLWSYPTDRWRPGETVADFHHLGSSPLCHQGECTLAVVVYDAETGEPVPPRIGQRLDPGSQLVLRQLTAGLSTRAGTYPDAPSARGTKWSGAAPE